jgi:MFS family permease
LESGKGHGFFYGYVVVAAAFGIQLVAWGIFNTFGVFFKPLLAEFDWSRATLSGVASLCFLIMGGLGVLVGILNDRFGPRLIMLVSGFFLAMGYGLLSQISSLWQMYLYFSLFISVGMCGADVALLSTVARWFNRRRSLMGGIVSMGTGTGIMAMPLVANLLIENYGWRWANVGLGGLCLVMVITCAWFLRRDPRSMGLAPYGQIEVKKPSIRPIEGGLTLRQARRTRQFWILCLIYTMVVFFSQTILVHIDPHTADMGFSPTAAANALAAVGGSSILGRFLMGMTGDRLGNRKAILICFGIIVAGLIWLLFARQLWAIYLFAAVYGFALSSRVVRSSGTRCHLRHRAGRWRGGRRRRAPAGR